MLFYALLILMAADTDRSVGKLVFQFGSAHIYEKHLVKLQQQLSVKVLNAPRYKLNFDSTSMVTDNFEAHMLEIHNYQFTDKAIKYELLT